MGEISANVVKLQRFSVTDGPGIRTTIFLKGCPLRCKWCANPETQKEELQYIKIFGQKDSALDGKKMTADQIIEEALRDLPFYQEGGGVTISGGEPLMHPELIKIIAEKLQERGVHVILDTCGYAPEKIVQDVVPHFNLVYFDLKHMDATAHKQYTGVGNQLILQNLKYISETGIPVAIRFPMIPGMNDSEENLMQMAQFVRELKQYEELFVLPYHVYGKSKYEALGREYSLSDVKVPSKEYVERVKHILRENGVRVHGVE